MLHALHPDTVVRCHCAGFRPYWRRPAANRHSGTQTHPRYAISEHRMGAPRIHGELLKLGIEIAQDTVSTAAFRVLYVFIVLRFDHYRIVHSNVAEHPSAQWTAQQSDGECYPPIYRKMCNRDLP